MPKCLTYILNLILHTYFFVIFLIFNLNLLKDLLLIFLFFTNYYPNSRLL